MSVTIEQIILDVKRVCNKQKDREALGDSIIVETESVNKHVEAMKEVSGLPPPPPQLIDRRQC